MLSKKDKTPTLNPEDKLIGMCATCKTYLELERWQAVNPTPSPSDRLMHQGADFWYDLPYGECSKCGSRVYLIKKPIQALLGSK